MMRSCLLLAAVALALAACAQEPQAPEAGDVAEAFQGGCLPGGDGRFEARLRGAIEADVAWQDAGMQCDGDVRPDGSGLRLTVAGEHEGRLLRFILGIDLADAAAGTAGVLPTNLTVLVEGEAALYATRGSGHCAVEGLERTPLDEGTERVGARGYCLDPATDLAGEARLLVPTFSFTALVRRGEEAAAGGGAAGGRLSRGD